VIDKWLSIKILCQALFFKLDNLNQPSDRSKKFRAGFRNSLRTRFMFLTEIVENWLKSRSDFVPFLKNYCFFITFKCFYSIDYVYLNQTRNFSHVFEDTDFRVGKK